MTTATMLPGKISPYWSKKAPIKEWGAKAKRSASPATAGGITMGKSIIVSIIFFPRTLLRAIALAVGIPRPTMMASEAVLVRRLILTASMVAWSTILAVMFTPEISKK